jgi:ribosomal protein S18 acetylase RimI-like enzyme
VAGVHERSLLDRRSDELALGIIEPLDARQRDRLGEAMRTVERLLTVAQIEMRESDSDNPDARECLRAYFAELERRSDSGIEAGAILPVDPEELRPPAGSFLLAYLRGEPIGCGGIRHHPGDPSEIKRMWVSETARGLGIGRRLLGELEGRARAAGAPAVRLETNRTLVEAIQMYRTAGYTEVPAFSAEPFADHWFEKSFS